jgi:5-methylcytosine-specific restriction protein A
MVLKVKKARLKLTALKSYLATLPARHQGVQTATVERMRGTTGVNDRNAIRRRDCGQCQQCKREGRATIGTEVDHIIPLWAGGSEDQSNKELLCGSCHAEKTSREAGERARGLI